MFPLSIHQQHALYLTPGYLKFGEFLNYNRFHIRNVTFCFLNQSFILIGNFFRKFVIWSIFIPLALESGVIKVLNYIRKFPMKFILNFIFIKIFLFNAFAHPDVLKICLRLWWSVHRFYPSIVKTRCRIKRLTTPIYFLKGNYPS